MSTKFKAKKIMQIAIGVAVFATAVFVLFGVNSLSGNSGSGDGDIIIAKSEITDQAKFYSYQAGDTDMEVLAVKATDGSVRTAFNTCQVCYSSGRGFYVQEGDELVCQNCGNRFNVDEVEVVRGGCNPVPIFEEDKSDDGTTITISKGYLEQNKDLFTNWSK